MILPNIHDESQIKGYVVIESISGYNTLSRAVGTPTGRLFTSEAGAEKLAASLRRENAYQRDYLVLPVQYDY